MGVSLIQWNANSLLAHIHELKHFLYDMDSLPDIICVQETFLKSSLNINIPEYSILRQDGKNGRGGVAIFLRNGITYSNVKYYEGKEGISVQIETINGPLKIFNFYVSPSYGFDESLFQEIFDLGNVFICGDFNYMLYV